MIHGPSNVILFGLFLISNFRRVLHVVFFILGDSSASETLYLSHLHRLTPPIKMGQTECSETSAHKIQTAKDQPKEII